MSTQAQRSIGEHIRRIAGAQNTRPQIMSGIVREVDEGDSTASVALSEDGDEPNSGVMLNAVIENDYGLLLIPEVGSDVWVAEIDGPDKWGIVKCSNVSKVIIKLASTPEVVVEEGKVTINGGENGGMVKVQELVTKLNTLENDINTLKTVIGTGWTPAAGDGGLALKVAAATWFASALTPTVVSDLENGDAKH